MMSECTLHLILLIAETTEIWSIKVTFPALRWHATDWVKFWYSTRFHDIFNAISRKHAVFRKTCATAQKNVKKVIFARDNASAGITVIVCLSVCLSVCLTPVLYQNGCTDRLDSFCTQVSLDLCYVEGKLGYPLKIRVLPSGTLSQTLEFENFVTAHRRSVIMI